MTIKQARKELSVLVKPAQIDGHINAIKELNGGQWSSKSADKYIKQIETRIIIG